MADIVNTTSVLAVDIRRDSIKLRLIQGFFSLDTEEHHAGNVEKMEWSDFQLGIESSNTSCGAQGSRASLESNGRENEEELTSADDAVRPLTGLDILRGIILHDRVP